MKLISEEYQCPQCKVVSEDWEWNEATYSAFGSQVIYLPNPLRDEFVYVCPDCKVINDGGALVLR